MMDSTCWAPDHTGEMRTTHAHFEGRCVTEPMDADFRERLGAYMRGGWDEWVQVKREQRYTEERTA